MRNSKGKAEFKWNCCQIKFSTRYSMERHMRLKNNRIKNYECQYWGLEWGGAIFLEKHLNAHTEIFKFKWDQWDKRFKDQKRLNCHVPHWNKFKEMAQRMNIAHPAPKNYNITSSKLDCSEGAFAPKRIHSHYIDASRKDTSVESSNEAIDHSLANNSASEKSYNLSDETPYNSDLNRTVEKIMDVSHEGITDRVGGRSPVLSLNDISDIFNKKNKETEIAQNLAKIQKPVATKPKISSRKGSCWSEVSSKPKPETCSVSTQTEDLTQEHWVCWSKELFNSYLYYLSQSVYQLSASIQVGRAYNY